MSQSVRLSLSLFVLIYSIGLAHANTDEEAYKWWARIKDSFSRMNRSYDASYIAKRSVKVVGLVLCGKSGCVTRRMKDDLIKCFSREMIEEWFKCVDSSAKARYTECDESNVDKVVNCTLNVVDKNPLLIDTNFKVSGTSIYVTTLLFIRLFRIVTKTS